MEDKYLTGLYDNCTPEDRKTVAQYFVHLQDSSDGWKLCALDFSQQIHSDDSARFFCLQVIESHIRTRHSVSTPEDMMSLRELLMSWMRLSNDTRSDKLFIKKKMAQLVALAFVIDYPHKWPSFFTDLLSLMEQGVSVLWTVELYLRILLAIDDEIVDREIIHTQEENVRNTVIKDTIRDTCAVPLSQSWFRIMTLFDSCDEEVTCLTLATIGAYVSWMDITLIVNDTYISLLLKYLSVSALRESAADCFHDILNKGMEPLSKIQLTESLFMVLKDVLTTVQTGEEDFEFLMKLSRLVNRVGIGLITCYNQLVRAGEQVTAATCFNSIENKVPFMLRFLSDEDDGVSENILLFSIQYITTLKHMKNTSDDTRQIVQSLLCAVIKKLKYDDSFNFIEPGEDEAVFMEFRVRLKVLYDNIALLDPRLTLEVIESHVTNVLSNIGEETFASVEVVLLLVIYLGDNNFEKVFGLSSSTQSPLYHIMNTVIERDISNHTHSAVVLQYYDVITKHDKFFTTCIHHIPTVLACFIDSRGLYSSNASVRSRVCYKFLQFLKSQRNHLGEYGVSLLHTLYPLLQATTTGSVSTPVISTNDMLFLFEAAGYLIVYCSATLEEKDGMMRSVVLPVLEQFTVGLAELYGAQSEEEAGQCLYMLLSYISRTSKVFSNHQQAQQSGCLQVFEEILPTILKGLQVTVQRDVLHSGVRQYLHRMVISLGDELLKYIPLAVTLLLKDCQSHDIQEFIPLINQLITKYKDKIVPVVQEIFTPVTRAIMDYLAQPLDTSDTEETRDRKALLKSYYLLINSICLNDILVTITNQGPQTLDEVLKSLIEGTRNSEPSIQRVSFQTLKKIVEQYSAGGGGESIIPPGFVEFTYKEVIPACFIVPVQAFDIEDAQSFLAIGEIAGLLKTMVTTHGDHFLLFLRDQFFPSIKVSGEIVQELLCKLQELDIRTLKLYLKDLFITLRAHSNNVN